MKFENEIHFKNYIRKIAVSCGFEINNFENGEISQILKDAYLFEKKYEMEIFSIGASSIIDYLLKELKQLYYCKEEQKLNVFTKIISEFINLLDETKEVCQIIEQEKIKADFNLYNYFDKKFLYPYLTLRKLVNSHCKFNQLNENEYIPSNKFKEIIVQNIGKCGIYFLYNEFKTLMYIGKSTSLGDRILTSINNHQIKGYVKIAYTNTRADIHIYEPYYILKENPVLNVEFTASDKLTIELKPLKKSKLIKILVKSYFVEEQL